MNWLDEAQNFLGIDEKHSNYPASEIVIVSAPYEHSVSYGGGTVHGPKAILEASHYVEFWDEEFQRELCFEKGICALPPIELGERQNLEALDAIFAFIDPIVQDGKFVVTLGGEHSISSAPIRSHLARHPNMSVLQFDAHSDLRLQYQDNPYSHASVMARVIEFLEPSKLVQVGIRAQCIEEYQLIQSLGIRTFFARDLHSGKHGSNWQQAVADALDDEVYITFDVDYFDPSIVPTTGTQEPGGFLWDETVDLLKLIGATKRIVGFDVVELAPNPDAPSSGYLSAKLVYKMLNAAFQSR